MTAAASGAPTLTFESDLRNDSIQAIADPGQPASVVVSFQAARGLIDDAVETGVFPAGETADGLEIAPPVSATAVAQAATAQGIPIVTLTPADPAALDALAIDDQAKAGISAALAAGMDVTVPAQDVTLGAMTTTAWFEIDSTTGVVIGVGEDGAHQLLETGNFSGTGASGRTAFTASTALAGQTIFAMLKAKYPMLVSDDFADLSSFAVKVLHTPAIFILKTLNDAAKNDAIGELHSEADDNMIQDKVISADVAIYVNNLIDINEASLKASDPPAAAVLLAAAAPLFEVGVNDLTLGAAGTRPAGPVAGTLATAGLAAAGTLAASWSTDATSGYSAQGIDAPDATVINPLGVVVGTGAVTLDASAATPVTVSGNVSYQVNGQGSLSFYGPAATSLGASGDWTSYTATATGNITMVVTTDALSVGSTALPLGTYTITAASATLTGSGPSTSPDFSSAATITTTGATINLGPATGSLSAGGSPLDATSGAALDGYSGTIAVAAQAGGTDSVMLNGTAANVLIAAPSTTTLTTTGDAPVTFQVNVQASLADTYNLNANTPPGWTSTIDGSGNVTVTPAPGTLPGTYPVVVIVQSDADPALIVQTLVEVTVNASQPGFTLAVAQDPLSTLPFNGAQLPTAFQATVENTGPAADTYTLTYSGIPSGFTLLDSAASLTVPAGATGLVGLYLMPNGQVPAVGTVLTLTVTATSMTLGTQETQSVDVHGPGDRRGEYHEQRRERGHHTRSAGQRQHHADQRR